MTTDLDRDPHRRHEPSYDVSNQPPRALAISPTHAIFLPRVKRQRFNQQTQKTVASACRSLPFVTRTLNNQQHAKKARQNTPTKKNPSLRSEPHERHNTEKDRLSPLSKTLFGSHGVDKAKDGSKVTPEDVLARKRRQTGGAAPPCSGPGRPRTRVRSAKSFPRTARNSEQRED